MMIWFAKIFWTSIGKKLLMAGTGLCFSGFLAIHLAGNFTLYAGGDVFNKYAEKLHQLGIFITLAEGALAVFTLIHVGLGLFLFYENLKARPVRYHTHKRAGGRTLGSATMPYTGFIILGFLIYHLLTFRFTGEDNVDLYPIVIDSFHQPVLVVFYVIAIIAVALHVSHGFWSAFQTIGADHVKYSLLIKAIRTVFYVVVAIGFGSIPVYMLLSS